MSTPSRAVFLSYASEDASAAQRIAETLRAAGIEVWFDREELRGGDAWDQRIRQQIRNCRLFVPIISAHSEARLEGYFRREWKLAVDRTDDMASEVAFLVPVVIDDTPNASAHVPERFRHVQWTRLRGGEATPAFVALVKQLLMQSSPISEPARGAQTPNNGTTAAPASALPLKERPSRRRLAMVIGTCAVVTTVLSYFAYSRFGHPGAPAIATAVSVTDKSIAVLPFVDLSEKHDQEYFADGMAEELLDALAKIPELKVIGRTSSFQFKGKSQDLRAVGSTLGARYLVEGSVRKSNDRLRVTAQLIDAADGSHVWSDTYDEPVGDALRIQDRIAANLARALQVTLGADFEFGHLKSVKAHELYLRGRHAYDRFDKEGLESAAAYFQQVLELEPDSVNAVEALAAVQDDLAGFGFVEPHEGFERARQTALRALQLDPNSATGHTVLADVHLIYEWDWAAAEREAKEAVRLKSRSHSAEGGLGMVYGAVGRWDESARMFESAIDVDPLFPAWHLQLGGVWSATGKLEAAESEFRKALQISPRYSGGHGGLGLILLKEGKLKEALAETQQEQPDAGRAAGLAIVYHALGRHADSDSALALEIKDHAQDDAVGIADAYAYRRQADQAFAWLERAYRQKDPLLWGIKSDLALRDLANDPRYKAFLRKMNLPE